jgi:uncharacterized protein
MATLITRLVVASSRHAWAVLLLAALLAGGAGFYAARHMAIDTDNSKLFSSHLHWRKRNAVFDAAFPQQSSLIDVVVDGTTPELADIATAALAKGLASHPELFSRVNRPDGGEFFERSALLYTSIADVKETTQQLIAVQPLLGSLAADPSLRGLMNALSLLAQAVKSGHAKLSDVATPFHALAETFEGVLAGHDTPLSWRTLIAGRKPTTREVRHFIMVQPKLEFGALMPGAKATDFIRKLAGDLDLTPEKGVRIRLTGTVPLADEEFATLAENALPNAVLTVLAVTLLLWFGLRSVRIILAILATLAVGLLATAAFGLLAIGRFNLISVAFAVLFVGLGVDLGIQFCVRYRAERHARGDLQEALAAAGSGVGGSLALAAAAIGAGFYAFLPTDYRGVSELGLIAGTGMVIAFLLSITLLPALIAVLRPPGEPRELGYAALAPLDRFLIRNRGGVLLAMGIVGALCLAAATHIRFDFNPLDLRSAKVESVATLLDLMKEPGSTPYTTDSLAPSLDEAKKLAKRLDALPEVAMTLTLASYIPADQEAKLALIADANQFLDLTLNPIAVKPAPTDEETVAAMTDAAAALAAAAGTDGDAAAANARRLATAIGQLASAAPAKREAAKMALIPGLDATLAQLRMALSARPITLESLPAELRRDWLVPDGRARVEAFPKGSDNDTLRQFVAAVRSVDPDANGSAASIQDSGRTVVEAFIRAGWGGLMAITLMLVIVLRRFTDVLLTLAPLFLSVLMTLGLSALFDWPLNFANIIALPLLFGIGVAFNIYFVMAWRKGESNPLQSSLTRAIIFSALTTTAAFGSLCLSSHPGTASMGRLLALSLGCTLASALLFLPALLAVPPRDERPGRN